MRKRRRPATSGGRVDVERIAEAVSRPGIDPRAWVSMARTSDDLSSTDYDPDYGWRLDAITYAGAFHGNTVCCRQMAQGPGMDGYGDYHPPGADEEIVVLFPGGDPDEDPIAIGVVSNRSGGGPPKTVAGRTIAVSDSGETSPGGPVDPSDCSFLKSPYSRVVEYEGEYHLKAKWVTFEASSPMAGIKLGSQTAKHPVPRGDNLVLLLTSLLTTLGTLLTAQSGKVSLLADPNGAAAASLTKLAKDLTDLVSLGVVVD